MAKVTNLTNEGAAGILNEFRATNPSYMDVIPTATADNVLNVTQAIAKYDAVLNDFTETMINKIVNSYANSPKFTNPLGRFKRESQEFGDTIEEIFVGLTRAKAYNPNKSAERLFKKEEPNISVAYHSLNRQDQYSVTISEEEMKKAMLNEGGLNNVVNYILESMNTQNEADEYVLMKSLLETGYRDGAGYFVEVGANFEENPKKFIEKARAYSGKVPFPTSNNYNQAGVKNSTSTDNLNLFLSADTNAKVDVNVLASAFNMNETEFLGRKQVLDQIADDNVLGMMVDDSFFVVADKVRRANYMPDPSALSTNHFLHVHQYISRSPFATFIIFVKEMPEWAKARVVTSAQATVVGNDGIEEDTIHVGLEGYDTLTPQNLDDVTITAKVDGDAINVEVDDENNAIKVSVNETGNPSPQRQNTITVTLTLPAAEGEEPETYEKEIIAQVSKYYGRD